MGKHGKKYQAALAEVDRDNLYSPDEALQKVKELASASFDETVELACKLGVNPRHADQQVRGAVVLPHGTGKDIRVVVFAEGEKAKEAQEAGADEVGADDLAEKIQGGWMDFDVAIATPDMMKVVGKLGRVLGPKGLMPNPKVGTVTFDIKQAVQDAKAGKVEYRVDKTSIIHVPVGKVSFSYEQLSDNFRAIMDALIKARPAAAKGRYLRSVTISSTMGPGIKLDPAKVTSFVEK